MLYVLKFLNLIENVQTVYNMYRHICEVSQIFKRYGKLGIQNINCNLHMISIKRIDSYLLKGIINMVAITKYTTLSKLP